MKRLMIALLVSSNVALAEPMLTAWDEKDIEYAKAHKTAELVYLDVLAWHEGLPDGSLAAEWAVESHAGDLNVCNSSDHCGHFQMGGYETRRYVKTITGEQGSKFNLSDAANGAVALAREYEKEAGIEIQTVTDMYILHQQGAGGEKAIRAAMQGKKLGKRIRINICQNLPQSQRKRLFDKRCHAKVDDQEIALTFFYLWDTELKRISDGLLPDNPEWADNVQ